MDAENELLIWGALRGNESFRRDLQRFFEAPTGLLRSIANTTKTQPYETLSEAEAEELADKFDWQVEELKRTVATFLLLKQRVVDTNRDPKEVLTESRDILGLDNLAEGREDEFADLFSYSEEELEESFAIRAFSGGPAFLSTRMLPTLLPIAPSGAELVAAYLWTISYVNAEGEQRSVTIGLTPGEIEQLEKTIRQAKEQLRAIKNLGGTSRAAGS